MLLTTLGSGRKEVKLDSMMSKEDTGADGSQSPRDDILRHPLTPGSRVFLLGLRNMIKHKLSSSLKSTQDGCR